MSDTPHAEPLDDSETEDNPRVVLDINGDFTLKDNDEVRFKLHSSNTRVQLEDGNRVPLEGVIALCPVVPEARKLHVMQQMGNSSAGVWAGTVYTPPSPATSPDEVFAQRHINTIHKFLMLKRFCIRRRHAHSSSAIKTMAVFTDGACLSNGNTTARGGYAFVYNTQESGTVSDALEEKGPDGQAYIPTHNRAKLRAVIAALSFRIWWDEGWERFVIISDSEYVTKGATDWLRLWALRNWKKRSGIKVANQDLWRELSEKMGKLAEGGCEVLFWAVPRAQNTTANQAAKNAAMHKEAQKEYTPHPGALV